jgi:uncharacterized membrane protein YccF (DUF307 family)
MFHNLKRFFRDLLDTSNTISSSRFIAVFSGIVIPIAWVFLTFYCAINKIGVPGGATEGYIGIFTIATLGRAYSSYTEMKSEKNKSEETQ